jgi:hypothetical protein
MKMRMVQKQNVRQQQKMSQKAIVAIAASSILILVVVLMLVFNLGNVRHIFAATKPKLDAKWTLVSNNGNKYIMKLSIHSNAPDENLGSSNFIFSYNTKALAYPELPEKGTHFTFFNFSNSPYEPGTVTHPDPETIFVNIYLPSGKGTSISKGFVDVCTLTFDVLDRTAKPDIAWSMSMAHAPNLEDVYDDQLITFDQNTLLLPVNNPQPVSVKNFSGDLKNNETTLNWTTPSEVNNDYFTIERRQDGSEFVPFLTKKSMGNSDEKHDYTIVDEQPLAGLSYYRLSSTDKLGKTIVHSTVSINNEAVIAENTSNNSAHPENLAIISINPTNFNDQTYVSYRVPAAGTAKFVATSTDGKTLLNVLVEAQEGDNSYKIENTSNWKPGLYILNLYFNGKSTFGKMVKQ